MKMILCRISKLKSQREPGPGKRRRMVAIFMQYQVMHPVTNLSESKNLKNCSFNWMFPGDTQISVYLQLTWDTLTRWSNLRFLNWSLPVSMICFTWIQFWAYTEMVKWKFICISNQNFTTTFILTVCHFSLLQLPTAKQRRGIVGPTNWPARS